MKLIQCEMKPYIQPFERKLALDELAALSKTAPQVSKTSLTQNTLFQIEQPTTYEVHTDEPVHLLARRLAYWEYLRDERIIATNQVMKEATLNVVRNGLPLELIPRLVPFKNDIPTPNRRCLRYGTHGVHEYRGKFFPQLVLALVNIAQVPVGGIVADPMCGSGTTPVEAMLAGCHAQAMDLNPLSVFMAQTKCELLRTSPMQIKRTYEQVRERLLKSSSSRFSEDMPHFRSLPDTDKNYLLAWFSKQALADLDKIAETISSLRPGPPANLLWLSLSNILRRVSWQKEDDLRVRKEIKADLDLDPIKEFLEQSGRSVRAVLALLYQVKGYKLGSCEVSEGDARRFHTMWPHLAGKVDAVITSPPYATALPYLDTDRLSLIYLRLLPRLEHRTRDQEMIGNREINDRNRQAQWKAFERSKKLLPPKVVKLIERIYRLNLSNDVGFRRRNLPSLLGKYFLDMRDVLAAITKILRPGASAYVVVGDNHTIAGGQRVEIETATHLASLAETVGLEIRNRLSMDMLVSRDIFRKNAVESECILSFRRPS
jgi:site-specific DNA-methyltransferase (cytosine-N4-specific)